LINSAPNAVDLFSIFKGKGCQSGICIPFWNEGLLVD
jgi:hypothetical protein